MAQEIPGQRDAVSAGSQHQKEITNMISFIQLLTFFIAWILANVFIEVIKGAIRQHQAKKMIDEIYLKVSKLALAAIKDVKR